MSKASQPTRPVERVAQAPPDRWRWRPGTLACLLCGGLALALGLLVYWTDRAPASASLIPGVAVLAHRDVFGTLGAWLPDFAHPFAFSLFCAVWLPRRPGPAYGACAAWFGVDALFELGQMAALSHRVADAVQSAPGSARGWRATSSRAPSTPGTSSLRPWARSARQPSCAASSWRIAIGPLLPDLRRGWRALGLAATVALGLIAIVGSGGGALGFPPCGPPLCGGEVPPPAPRVQVTPSTVTALVGSAVTLTASVTGLGGTASYQWRRSADGGASFVDIVGATGTTLVLPAVNLADDGAVVGVTLYVNGSPASFAGSRLTVSAVPGVVIADGEFEPANWVHSPAAAPSQYDAVLRTEERMTGGGNPGAWRRMAFQLQAVTGASREGYLYRPRVYEPRLQGGIKVIDYSEDCLAGQSTDWNYTVSFLLIEQDGRRYVSSNADTGDCRLAAWSTVSARASLRPADFALLDGPACDPGATCPDFSSSAAPLRFGYWRVAHGNPNDVVVHGIDNWRVTVWPR